MRINTFSIMGELDRCGVSLQERGYLLTVAFARAVAYRLPLPAEPVENPYRYFIETHKAAAEEMLSEINERVVLDIDAAADLLQRVWIFRYRLVHDAHNVAVRNFLDAMIRVGSRELPPAVSELMVRCKDNDALDIITRAVGMAIEEG